MKEPGPHHPSGEHMDMSPGIRIAQRFAVDTSFNKKKALSMPRPLTKSLGKPRVLKEPLLQLPNPGPPPTGSVEYHSAQTHESLSRLLYFSFGRSSIDLAARRKQKTIHRPFPSARSIFPTRLSLVAPLLSDALYDYVPSVHALSPLGSTAPLSWLNNQGAGAPIHLIVWTDMAQLAQQYGFFAFKLATLEAGHAIANLELVAGLLGWYSQRTYHFSNSAISQLLGLVPPCQYPLCILSVGPTASSLNHPLPTPEWIPHLRGLDQSEGSSGMDGDAGMLRVLELQQAASYLVESGHQRRKPIPPDCWKGSAPLLAKGLANRHSGLMSTALLCRRSPRERSSFRRMLSMLHDIDNYDAQDPALRPDILLSIENVSGLSSGGYRVLWQEQRLSVFRPDSLTATALMYEEYIDASALQFIVVLNTPLNDALVTYGARGFQLSLLESGRIAQFLALSMSDATHFLRPFGGVRESVIEQWSSTYKLHPGYVLLGGEAYATPSREELVIEW